MVGWYGFFWICFFLFSRLGKGREGEGKGRGKGTMKRVQME